MNRSHLALAFAAPLLLAACQPEPTTTDAAPVVVAPDVGVVAAPPPGGTPVVVPGGTTSSAPVVVNPTQVISTNLAELAGSYDASLLACRGAPTETRVILAASKVNIGSSICDVTDTARDGSSLRVSLACENESGRGRTTINVTPAAQGITLRIGNSNPATLRRCEA